MIVNKTSIVGCKQITPEVFSDFRGEYIETWNKDEYKKLFPPDTNIEFVQDDISVSRKNTLRGFHGDAKTWKLIQVPLGTIFLVVIDTREDSESYGVHDGFHLSDKNRQQVLIPSGCAIAHLCLTSKCIFDYKQSEYYDRKMQFSYNYKSNGVMWPVPEEELVLSDRDRYAPIWERKSL